MSDDKKLIVLAIGGNSLIIDKNHESIYDQYQACYETCRHIAPIIKLGHRVVITHGNGPQVGFIMRRAELSRAELHPVPLDSCDADTQGAIGYLIQKAMWTLTRDWEDPPSVVTVVTQVLVDPDDPSFAKPSKPIGTFMDEQTARQRAARQQWEIVEDAGRGWRRVVPSPVPRKIIELKAIQHLLDAGFVVVAVGGGGIPVVIGADGGLEGVEAVIDKDLASGLLAQRLGADTFFISTVVEQAYLNYGKPDQQPIDVMTVAEARRYMDEGHFAPGSMKPKIAGIIEFLEAGGKEAIISNPPNLERAIRGETGTRVVP